MFNADLDKMIAMSAEAKCRPNWQLMAEYLSLRGQGIRKPALKALAKFVDEAAIWQFEDRLELSLWILKGLNLSVVPSPLLSKVIHPTCREWSQINPLNAEAHLWLGKLGFGVENYERAIALDPDCAEARGRKCLAMIDHVWFNQHHLPDSYLGNPSTDLLDLAEAEAIWRGRVTESWAEHCLNDIKEYRLNAEEWLRLHPPKG